MELSWPLYPTGPHDSMHALGVASVNFANFERATTWVFAAVSKMAEDDARAENLRAGTTATVAKIEQASRERAWTGTPHDLVQHFVVAANVLIDNRNLLMHSVVIHDVNDNATLYRTTRRCERQMVQATAAQIRAVADDLQRYFDFALALANCIAVKVDGADRQAGTIVYLDWPEMPVHPLPLLTVARQK